MSNHLTSNRSPGNDLTTPAPVSGRREELIAMKGELQANRKSLSTLAASYDMLAFTGGYVPTVHWELAAVTSYLDRGRAIDGISAERLIRYSSLVTAIADLGQEMANSGPKTLPRRCKVAERFRDMSSEIEAAGLTLESTIAEAQERDRDQL